MTTKRNHLLEFFERREEVSCPKSLQTGAWMQLKGNRAAFLGLVVVLIFIFMAIFAPILSPYRFSEQSIYHANLPPKIPLLEKLPGHWFDGYRAGYMNSHGVEVPAVNMYQGYDRYHYFGTDDLGRDQWTRLWSGVRVSLLIALIAGSADLLIGVIYGGISGFFGGRVDMVMQRIVEVLMGIPHLIVVILLMLVFEAGVFSMVLAMVLTGWIPMARVVRGQFLKLKHQEFVLSARALGASNWRLIFKHLLPNAFGPILIVLMFSIPSAIFVEAFLSFIGLGVQPPLASLGTLVNDGLSALQIQPYKLAIPAIAISVLILSFNLLADGLRDVLDPKLRKLPK